MNKYLKLLAPVILSLYFCAGIVGLVPSPLTVPVWGDTLPGEYLSSDNNAVSFNLKFNKPDSNGTTAPMGKVPFEMKMSAFYKNERFKSIRIVSSEALDIQKSVSNKGGFLPGIISESYDYTFLIVSPTKQGMTYHLTFEGLTENGEKYLFSQKLVVDMYEKPQKDLSVYLLVGAVCGSIAGASALSEHGGAVGVIIGAPLGGLIGAFAGVMIGNFFGPEPEEQ